MVTLAELREETNNKLNASFSFLDQEQRDRDISSAIREYSKRKPYLQTLAVTGNSTGFYDLPSDYEKGFSVIREIEYPIQENPPTIIRPKNYTIDNTPSGDQLRFWYENPGANNTFWVRYTARHWYDTDGATTIPESDMSGVIALCLSKMCKSLASFYANKSNPNIPEAEPFQYDTRVAEYNSLSNSYYKQYTEMIKREFTGVHGQIDFSQDMYYDRNYE